MLRTAIIYEINKAACFFEKKSKKKSKFMDFLFYIFSSLTLVSGALVIQARNPVHSVLFLVLVFF